MNGASRSILEVAGNGAGQFHPPCNFFHSQQLRTILHLAVNCEIVNSNVPYLRRNYLGSVTNPKLLMLACS